MRVLLITCILWLVAAIPLLAGNSVFGVWTLEDSPVYLLDDTYVPAGESLTIEAGVEVFISSGSGLRVYGQLLVYGTEDNWVVFRGAIQGEEWEGITIFGPAKA